MTGVGLFGGTRMLYKANPDIVRPGVTEIFPAVASQVPAIILGVLVRSSKFRFTDRGVVIGDEAGKDFFTVLHPKQQACAVVQDNADSEPDSPFATPAPGPSIWDLEYLRCADIVGELHGRRWQSLLSIYNGGGVTEKELKLWAQLGKEDPGKWNVLLFKGSGGAADKYAANEEWLAEHPHVHVCGLNTEEIRAKYLELGAITYESAETPTVNRQTLPSAPARGEGIQDYRKRTPAADSAALAEPK